jgi:cytochrome c-type biogenesis protein CcmH
MVLWIGFAVLAVAVTWAVTRPLLAARADDARDTESELAVYRDQLSEIESEREQGLIGADAAEAARVEVARRLIRTAESGEPSEDANPKRGYGLVLAVAAAVPVLALGIYLSLGQPTMPARPYASRLDAPVEKASANDLVARVEAHLRTNPDDGRGWDVLAPVYMRMGDFAQAAQAYERALRFLGESPQRLAGYARATIMSENGVVNEPARRAYVKLQKLEPDSVEPKVWLAIAKEQDGDLEGAAADYRALLGAGVEEEPWKSLLNQRLLSVSERLGMKNNNEPPAAEAAPSPPGRSGDRPDFHTMTPEQRQEFIQSMVDGLAARLKDDGNDLNGWMKLMRAYVVLGRRDDASAALEQARSNFNGDENALAQLQALANVLRIGS